MKLAETVAAVMEAMALGRRKPWRLKGGENVPQGVLEFQHYNNTTMKDLVPFDSQLIIHFFPKIFHRCHAHCS